LISPAFDLSGKDSIGVEFDMYLNAMYPTVEYSTDNKQTWQTLYYNGIPAQNWLVLYNEPVCNLQTFGVSSPNYVHAEADVSQLLINQPLVYFRYKICGPVGTAFTFWPAGFRIDNFLLHADSTEHPINTNGINDLYSNVNIGVSISNGQYVFNSQLSIQKLEVYDISGKILYTEAINSKQAILDISILRPGIYLVNLMVGNATITKKIIVI
jgi:hypothetical protein